MKPQVFRLALSSKSTTSATVMDAHNLNRLGHKLRFKQTIRPSFKILPHVVPFTTNVLEHWLKIESVRCQIRNFFLLSRRGSHRSNFITSVAWILSVRKGLLLHDRLKHLLDRLHCAHRCRPIERQRCSLPMPILTSNKWKQAVISESASIWPVYRRI